MSITTKDEHFDWQEGRSKPLTKELKEKLVGLGVDKFDVDWSGGCDEGYGDVSITWNKATERVRSFFGEYANPERTGREKEAYDLLYDWAIVKGWYSGAGDGTDYGDTFIYDLQAGTVEHTEWCMEQSSQNRGVVDRI